MLKKWLKFFSIVLFVITVDIYFICQINFNDSSYNQSIATLDEDALMILNIPKIKLSKKIYNTTSKNNDISKNVMLIKNGKDNIVLAAHSGNSKVAFFSKLDELSIGDEIILYYNNKKIIYYLNNMYDIKKTGYAKIKREKKNTLTLITCKRNSKTKQVVYIAYES